MSNFDREIKWSENVSKAKDIVQKVRGYQMLVAGLAMEVCEITRGGNKKEFSERYTIRRFAKEIKCHHKTLSQYVAIRTVVFNKLKPNQKSDCIYSNLEYVARHVQRTDTAFRVQKVYEKFLKEDPYTRTIIRYLKDLRSLHKNYAGRRAAPKLSKEINSEVLFFCGGIIHHIKKELPKIKPKLNGLSHSPFHSAARSTGAIQ